MTTGQAYFYESKITTVKIIYSVGPEWNEKLNFLTFCWSHNSASNIDGGRFHKYFTVVINSVKS